MLEWCEVTRGLAFPEGPIALPDGSILLVEMQRQTLTCVAPDGTQRVVAKLNGGPNGAAIGPDGRCYVCNNGGLLFHSTAEGLTIPDLVPADYTGGWIEAVDLATGRSEVLYRECKGVPLFGPNDLVFDALGGFYFTDSGKVRQRDRDRGAVFYARTDGSFIRRIAFPVEGANGIGLSPDDTTLYVAESTTGRLWAYDLNGPGEIKRVTGGVPWLRGRMLFATPHFSVLDSLAVDSAGNICVADIPSGGITVVSPLGMMIEQHATPDAFTTNICFGGADLRQAFVTLSSTGRLVTTKWPRAGLALHWLNRRRYSSA
jgi:gluconolactonase